MAVRYEWEVYLRCPVCRASGTALVSDVDHPPTSTCGTLQVEQLPAGFRLARLGETMRATKFECVKCGVQTQR